MDEKPATSPTDTELPLDTGEKPIDWLGLLSTVWNSRKLIAIVVGATTVLAVIVSLLLPKYYKSTTTLLPETEKSKLATALGGLSGLASLAGISTGKTSLATLYPAIIQSEAVLEKVIYSKYQTDKFEAPVNLIQFWEIEADTRAREYELALESLRSGLDVSLDRKTSVVTISIETREPQLSADILNNITRTLDGFIRTKQTTSASEQRQWIEARLVEVKEDLAKSENSLKDFREKNRRVRDSPQLLLEQERLIREVGINTTLYTELKKQYEVVKIEEIKNIPIINVMDPARPAAEKSSPRRPVIVLISFFLSAFGSLFFVIFVNRYNEELSKVVHVFGWNSEEKVWRRIKVKVRKGLEEAFGSKSSVQEHDQQH